MRGITSICSARRVRSVNGRRMEGGRILTMKRGTEPNGGPGADFSRVSGLFNKRFR